MKNHLSLLAFISCSFFATHCARLQSEPSSEKISNGVKRQLKKYAAIVSLDHCSATFVSPTTLLTAAHCMKSAQTYNGVKSLPTFSMGETRGEKWAYANDVRVVVFPSEVADTWIKVGDCPVKLGEKIVVAGFGHPDWEGQGPAGDFRYGSNVIDGFDTGDRLITSHGTSAAKEGKAGQDSSITAGDSGGPLLRAADNTIIGVASAGDDKDPGRTEALHVNLCSSDVRDFLKAAQGKGADIRFASSDAAAK